MWLCEADTNNMVVLIKEKGPFLKSTAIILGKNTKAIR